MMNKTIMCLVVAVAAALTGCGGGGGGVAPGTGGTSGTGGTGGTGGTTGGGTPTQPAAASVSAVNATAADFATAAGPRLGQQAYFQVTGSNLPAGLALNVAGCADMNTVSTSATEAHFKCTPVGVAGTRAVTVMDKPGGTTLSSSSVAVQAAATPASDDVPLPMPTYGFNLGNSLEAVWGYAIPTKAVFTNAAAAGFNAVRIPCAWMKNADSAGNIDPAYMAKVKQAVDWSIAEGMYVMINVHWDGGWFDNNIGDTVDPVLDAKFRKAWSQIATAFSGYDNHLLFAAANEPEIKNPTKMKTLMAYYQSFVNTVRAAGGKNPNRWLILPIQGDASWIPALPTDSTPHRLMLEFHNYTPSLFTIIHEDQSWGKAIHYWGAAYHNPADPTRNATFGEEGDIDLGYQQLKEQFVDKGIPVLIGEYQAAPTPGLTGDAKTWNNASMLYWNKFVGDSARAHGLSPFYWSTPNAPFTYDSAGTITNQDIVNVLTGGAAPSPPNGAPYAVTGLVATGGTGQVTLSWNAVAGATSYSLYRTTKSGSEPATASVTGITGTSYTDTGLNDGTTYYYRVVAVNGSGASGFSTEAHAATPGTNPDPTQFSFETDTRAWTPSGDQIGSVATSTAQHYAGRQSMAVNFSGTSGGTSSVDASYITLPAGTTVTFHVWVPAGSKIKTIEPYATDYNWGWASNPTDSFTAGAWNTLTLKVPSTSITPLNRLGLRFTTSAAWTGTVHVDSIDWTAQ
jgi:aryl-phospho-beta-D-glucosidase BglC (GH1 family)